MKACVTRIYCGSASFFVFYICEDYALDDSFHYEARGAPDGNVTGM